MEANVEKVRHFGGQLFVRKAGKEWTTEERLLRNIEKKHLKAYLRGDTRFTHNRFGYDKLGYPIYKEVNAIFK